MERVGVLGGTFNPVHRGHMQVAAEVRERFSLARVVLVPSALPPHKSQHDLAPAQDRLAMLRLAAAGEPGLEVSEIELHRSGPSYTIDTLREMQSRPGPRLRLYFILGADAFFEIDTWKDFHRLLREAPLIIVTRPGTDGSGPRLLEFLTHRVGTGYTFCPSHGGYLHATNQAVYPCPVTPMAVSSTQVRRAARRGNDLSLLVPPAVAGYLRNKGLYR